MTEQRSNIFTTIAGRDIRWTDPQGRTHAVEGTETPEGMLLWPRCGKGDVPPDAAKLGNDLPVTCPDCAAILGYHAASE